MHVHASYIHNIYMQASLGLNSFHHYIYISHVLDSSLGWLWYDFTTRRGYAWAIFKLLRVVEKGIFWAAPKCSNWVYINKGTSLRSIEAIYGDISRKDIRDANLTAERMAVLMQIAHCQGLTQVTEQPASSLFFEYPDIKVVREKSEEWDIPIWRFFLWFGSYGHNIAKPTVLYSTCPDTLALLFRGKPEPKHEKGAQLSGDWICGSKELSASQEYTVEWCEAFRNYCEEYVCWEWAICPGQTVQSDSEEECQQEREQRRKQAPLSQFSTKRKYPSMVEVLESSEEEVAQEEISEETVSISTCVSVSTCFSAPELEF